MEQMPRRRADIASLAALVGLLLQMAGGVWYMSRLDSSVQQLNAAVAELKTLTQQGGALLVNHGERIKLLEHQRMQDDRETERLTDQLRAKGSL